MHRSSFIALLTLCLCDIVFAQQPKLVLPVGHTSPVFSAEFSSDNKYVVTASVDHTAKVWESMSGKLLFTLDGHTCIVFTAHFSPDDRYIVTGSLDMTAKIWDATSGRQLCNLKGHTGIVYSAVFSSDGKYIVTASQDSTAKVWNVATGILIRTLKSQDGIAFAIFSPSGKYIATASGDTTAAIWNAQNGNLLYLLKGHHGAVLSAIFSRNEKYITTASEDSTAKIWEVASGNLVWNLSKKNGKVNSSIFSPDGNFVLTSGDSTAMLWNVRTGNLAGSLTGHHGEVYSAVFSPDGKSIVTVSTDHTVKIWHTDNARLIYTLYGHDENVVAANFSTDGKRIVTSAYDVTARIWDVSTGKLIWVLAGHTSIPWSTNLNTTEKNVTINYTNKSIEWGFKTGRLLNSTIKSSGKSPILSFDGKYKLTAENNIIKLSEAENNTVLLILKGDTGAIITSAFSAGGKYIAASSVNKTFIWESKTGKLLPFPKDELTSVSEVKFSPDEKFLFTRIRDKSYKLWDIESGIVLINSPVNGRNSSPFPSFASFSPDNKYLIAMSDSGTTKLWEAKTGKLMHTFKREFGGAVFRPDSKNFITKSLELCDVETGRLIYKLTGHKFSVRYATFNSDGSYILTAGQDGNAIIWDVKTGKEYRKLVGYSDLMSAQFSSDSKYIVTASSDGVLKLWSTERGKLLYSFILIDSSNFLIIDSLDRYEGTEAARKLLYFTCGREIIELDQVKDQLWVPNLAERIMNGDTINAPKLSDLNICGLSPEVEDENSKADEYHFKILPRRGGLGETVLYVNGIEAKRYKPEQLKKNGGVYELLLKKQELNPYFIAGAANPVMVKAYTSDNATTSRGFVIEADNSKQATITPNLFGVMIGVSDYKGDGLDLQYAAKDATDISTAVSNAAKKLLNMDGRDHVFMYNLTTAKEHYQLPEKLSIKKILEEIGKKATANDILLIFFAGHGVMQGNAIKKQFYFLTADASQLSATNAAVVGISTAELTEWMKPANIKAQKRILIFDACNSGQAIKDFVQLGNKKQNYVAARNDDKSQLIKAIDKLNEKSGLFILSASASNQSAYEMGRYSQGLLTYSLLKAIKQQPDILEDGKYLNLSRWFNAAEKTVSELSKESGARQEPQIVTNTNFNIGIVDEEVMAKIVLPMEKPLFAASNFQNSDETIADDNLELSKMINLQLNDIASRGTDSKLVYVTATNSPDAYSLSGRYTIKDNAITVTINIKQNKVIKSKFEQSGSKDKLNELAAEIADKAAGMIK